MYAKIPINFEFVPSYWINWINHLLSVCNLYTRMLSKLQSTASYWTNLQLILLCFIHQRTLH